MTRLLLALLALPLPLWAQTTTNTSAGGAASTALSMRLLCSVGSVMEGNLGLLAGLCLALYGLYLMVRNGALKTGILLIIAGALFTSLLSLVESAVAGLSQMLVNNKVSLVDTSGPMQKALSYSGACDSIPVDFSSYETVSASVAGIPNLAANQREGAPAPAAFTPSTADANNSCRKGNIGASSLLGGDSVTVTSCFGWRPAITSGNRYVPSQNHPGVDLIPVGNSKGDFGQVHALGGGTVRFAGMAQYGDGSGLGGYGYVVQIDQGGGTYTVYGHLATNPANFSVAAGQAPPQTIGQMGSTGMSTGAHLHYGKQVNKQWQNPCGDIGC